MLIIILAFVPVFTLVGEEGKLFHPLAFTKTFAMVGATLLAVTIVPVLCTFWVRGPFRREEDNWLMKRLLSVYDPALNWALAHRRDRSGRRRAVARPGLCPGLRFAAARWCARSSRGIGIGAAKVARGMGSEFMPTLNEGSLLFMPVLLPSTSLTEIKRLIAWQDEVIEAGARSPIRRRQTRPLRDRHRPGAGRDDRNHHRAETRVANGGPA